MHNHSYTPKGWIAVVKRELKLMTSRSTYSLILGILPVIAIGVMTLFFNKGVPRDLPIGLVDLDNSGTSRKLARMVDAAPAPKITAHFSSTTEASKAMKSVDVYGIVVIPKDFEKDIYGGKQPEVSFFYNNAYMIVGGILNKDVSTVISTFITGVDYNLRLKKGVPDKKAMAMAMPIMPDTRVLFNPYTNYFYYLTIAFLPIMLLMFILSGTVYAIGSEFKYHRADEWLSVGHGSIFRALTAKLFPYVIVFILLVTGVNAILFGVFNTPLNGSIIVLVYNSILFVMSYVSMAIVIIAIFPSLRMALSVAAIYAALAFTMSGLTFPQSAMYEPIQYVAELFPFTHYLRVFIEQSLQGAPLRTSVSSLIALNLFLMVPFAFLPRLKKICKSPSLWGKN